MLAHAKLSVLRQGSIAYRALRRDEVDLLQRTGEIRAKSPASRATVAEVIALGTSRDISPYVHATWDIWTALYYAESESAHRSGHVIVAIDVAKLAKRRQRALDEICIDVILESVRRSHDVAAGSTADAFAALRP